SKKPELVLRGKSACQQDVLEQSIPMGTPGGALVGIANRVPSDGLWDGSLHVAKRDLLAVVLHNPLPRMKTQKMRVMRQPLGKARDLLGGVGPNREAGFFAAGLQSFLQLFSGHSRHLHLRQCTTNRFVLAD